MPPDATPGRHRRALRGEPGMRRERNEPASTDALNEAQATPVAVIVCTRSALPVSGSTSAYPLGPRGGKIGPH